MNRVKVLSICFLVIPALAVLQVCSASAAPMTFGGGAHVGIAFSSFPSDVKDYYGTGYVFGGQGDLNVMKYFTARFSVDYYMFSSDKSKLATVLARAITVGGQAADPSKLSVSGLNSHDLALGFSGIGKLPTGSVATPYGIVGFNINFLSAGDLSVAYAGVGDITQRLLELQIIGKTESKTNFGIHFGVGSEFKVGITRLYAEFKYHLIFTEGSSTSLFPFVVGVNF